jgi:hypothetical protein
MVIGNRWRTYEDIVEEALNLEYKKELEIKNKGKATR